MPLILIKNNLKLMLRSKWVLFIMSILPLITIALLSNAFKEMMNTSYDIGEFQVGYRVSEDSVYKDMLPELTKTCEEKGIQLQEYPDGDITKLLQSETVAVFVKIGKDSYTVYQSNDKSTEASITESIFSGFFYQANESKTLLTYQMQHNITDVPVPSSTVKSEVLATDPVPSSTDYYGIIYILYFTWCGIISLVAVISSERKSAIPRRMRVSQMSKLQFYFGKFLPCTLAIFIEVCIAWGLSVVLFGIHWGNIGISAFVLFLTAMAASAFGIVLFQLFNNVAISIVLGFIIIWIEGFFGGSFQTYMYANLPQRLVNLSPIYYVNRAMVEYSTMGHSGYLNTSIGFLAGIIIVCGILGTLLMNRKMEEQS
ncbi:MAG TPA: ABC transporter permease [Mobilitalea sp.]|nr:ABC transporter permease [Mobilitalea sp.]